MALRVVQGSGLMVDGYGLIAYGLWLKGLLVAEGLLKAVLAAFWW